MNREDGPFPARDERLGEALLDATADRVRSEAEWDSLRHRIVDAAELPLARRRAGGWWTPLAERAPGLVAAAAVVLLVLGGIVLTMPRVDTSFAAISAELIDLLGEDEVNSFFPGADDTERLLEAALAAQ